MKQLIDRLEKERTLSREEFFLLLSTQDERIRQYAYERARAVSHQYFRNHVYIRGLIEFSNYCKNNCYYCGIRRDNGKVNRYRLSKEDIFACCQEAYALGFRTFVMQSGEDDSYTDNQMVEIIQTIRNLYPDCAITLSVGEKQKATYQRYYNAGANRFLLRHETSNDEHYAYLHPSELTLMKRKQCLQDLKAIGFQVGSGMMIGSPKQTLHDVINDFYFLQALQPEMIGVGPYLPHVDTPFKEESPGDLQMTLFVIALLRLQFPNVLLPSTTALATLVENGRELGILAGANVIMPNISPLAHRKDYALYNHKASSGAEAKEGLAIVKERMKNIGYEIVVDRGDFQPISKGEQHVSKSIE